MGHGVVTTNAGEGDAQTATTRNRPTQVGSELSSGTLTDTKKQVLQQGQNFAPTPRRIPGKDVVAAVRVTHRANTKETSELRGNI